MDPISLGTASSFSVLSPTIIVTNLNSVINGDAGYQNQSGSGILNVLNGENPADTSTYNTAIADLNNAICYIGIQNYISTDTSDIGSLSPLMPGAYLFTNSATFNSVLTLSGSGQYVFYFMNPLNIYDPIESKYMVLTGGATSSNIYFYSPYEITISTNINSTIYGNFISDISVSIINGVRRNLTHSTTESTTKTHNRSLAVNTVDELQVNSFTVNGLPVNSFTVNGVTVNGRILSSTGNLQITSSTINNEDVSCYTEDCYIELYDGSFKLIKDLSKTDKIKIHGVFGEHMNYNKFDNPKFTCGLFLGKLTLHEPTPNNYPVEISMNNNTILVSPKHRIIIDGISVYAKDIGKRIKVSKINYYHVLCNKHYAINVNGFITETMHYSTPTKQFESLF